MCVCIHATARETLSRCVVSFQDTDLKKQKTTRRSPQMRSNPRRVNTCACETRRPLPRGHDTGITPVSRLNPEDQIPEMVLHTVPPQRLVPVHGEADTPGSRGASSRHGFITQLHSLSALLLESATARYFFFYFFFSSR